MWAKASRWVARYPEGVVTVLDDAGYPVSVRQASLPYDGATGTMPVVIPDALAPQEGAACLLCHFHDENLWNLSATQLRGRLEKHPSGWVFVTRAFTPPSFFSWIRSMRASSKEYLQKRGLVGSAAPVVDFAAIERLWERAGRVRKG